MGVFYNRACDVSLFWGPFKAVDMRRIQIKDSCLNLFISFCCCDYMNSEEMLVYINRCIRVMENIQLYSNTILFVCCCCFGFFGCCCYFVVVFEGWGLCVDHAIEGFYCLTHDHTHACTLTHSFTPHTQGEKNMKENIGRMLDLRTLKLSSHFQLDSLEKKRKQHDVSLNLHFKLHRPKAF